MHLRVWLWCAVLYLCTALWSLEEGTRHVSHPPITQDLYHLRTTYTSPHLMPSLHPHPDLTSYILTVVGLCTLDWTAWLRTLNLSCMHCLPASYLAWVCSQLQAFQNQRLCNRCYPQTLQHSVVFLLLPSPFPPPPAPCSCCWGGMPYSSPPVCSFSSTHSDLCT